MQECLTGSHGTGCVTGPMNRLPAFFLEPRTWDRYGRYGLGRAQRSNRLRNHLRW